MIHSPNVRVRPANIEEGFVGEEGGNQEANVGRDKGFREGSCSKLRRIALSDVINESPS